MWLNHAENYPGRWQHKVWKLLIMPIDPDVDKIHSELEISMKCEWGIKKRPARTAGFEHLVPKAQQL